MPRIAIYAGSFDPVTFGHEDLIQRAAFMFDKLIVAIGVNPAKKPVFTTEERLALLKESASVHRLFIEGKVELASFEGMLVKFCLEKNAQVIVRGLRAVSDFESELGIAHANTTQVPEIETIFLPTKPEYSFVSSSAVREIAKLRGNLRQYVNPTVESALWKKLGA